MGKVRKFFPPLRQKNLTAQTCDRIKENLKTSETERTEDEYKVLEKALPAGKAYGHRGHGETEQNPTVVFNKAKK